jgi:hypothetical protein
MRCVVIAVVAVACGGKRSLPPLPEIDAEAWSHVHELAKPAAPNGSTKELEVAISIATKHRWLERGAARISKDQLPEFDAAMVGLRTWRDQRGGVILIDPLATTGAAGGTSSISRVLLATEDPEAVDIVLAMGQRTLEQSDSLLNGMVGIAMVADAIERAKKGDAALIVDVGGLDRGLVRSIAGEVLWMRKLRERIAGSAQPTDSEREHAGEVDDNIRTLVDVLREVRPDTTAQQLLGRLRTAERTETTKLTLDTMIAMVEKWRDQTAKVFVP